MISGLGARVVNKTSADMKLRKKYIKKNNEKNLFKMHFNEKMAFLATYTNPHNTCYSN